MLKRVWNGISIVLVCMFVLLAILLVGVRLFGLQPYAVLSGSMAPAYRTGALIYVRQAAPQEVQTGDPITFYLGDGSTVATHRVVRIDAQAGCFYTKGDANEMPDGSPVSFGQLIGMPVFSIPVLGYVSVFMATPAGLCTAVFAVLVMLLLMLLPGLLKKTAQQDDGGDAGLKQGRRAVQEQKAP